MSVYLGVNFNNVRKALWLIYYGEAIAEEDAYKYILPMKQNFFNPVEDMGDDTYIQYFIDRDERITQDQFGYNTNFLYKMADVSLRFIGKQAEDWAKATHHFTKRTSVSKIFAGVCNASFMEAIGDIYPITVDFFGKNPAIAFDVEIKLQYNEVMKLDWEPLTGVTLAPGEII